MMSGVEWARGLNADGNVGERQHARVLVAWKARLLGARGGPVEAKAVDLSEVGLGLLSSHSVGAPGAPLDLWLAVPADNDKLRYQGLRLGGRVVFQIYAGGDCRIGLQFTRIDTAARDLLRHWVRRSPPLR
jgi:PilZ domain